jgi:hypothetical protein
MWSAPVIPQYRTYVIHGPAYERARPGGYWGQGDALRWYTRVGSAPASGVVIIDCLDQELADRLQGMIDGLGLVAGLDYAMQCESGQLVETPEVRWVPVMAPLDVRVEAVARIAWSLSPMPAEVRELHSRLDDSRYDVRWPALRDVAIERGAKPETIEAASRQPTDYERWCYLGDALSAKYHRAWQEAEANHRPVLLSQTYFG